MVNGLVAPDAVYFTSPDDGICWLRVTNEGAAAMEFDSADELFTGQVLTSGDMLSMEELQQKPELMLELSESDRALVAAFDLSESRRPANEAAGREGTSDASVEGAQAKLKLRTELFRHLVTRAEPLVPRVPPPIPRLFFFFPTTVPLFLHLAPAGLAVLAVFLLLPFWRLPFGALPFWFCCLLGFAFLALLPFWAPSSSRCLLR